MAYSVVCVSGPDGAHMREVAKGVSERLGFALVDEQIILRAAAEAGVAPDEVADVETRRSLVERALEAVSPNIDMASFALAGVGYVPSQRSVSDELRELIRTAIEETAARGRVVIVAHAASHALGLRPDVLRVLVTASEETRRSRVASDQDLDAKAAARLVGESDAGRADYLRRFYGAKSELPTQYDVVVSTDRLSPDDAVSLVAQAATC